MNHNVFFVSGIDTDAGKSYATGYLAREWNKKGIRTLTQKMVQTGNNGDSEDIALHRKIMGIPYTAEDRQGLTMPEIFTYPASPLLASRMDGRPLNLDKIEQATQILASGYDRILLEGAGGLMVPLTDDLLTIDYIRQKEYPLILVTSGKLGSINHTLLSLEAIQHRNIRLYKVLYNLYPEEKNPLIQKDSYDYIRNYLKIHFPETGMWCVPKLDV